MHTPASKEGDGMLASLRKKVKNQTFLQRFTIVSFIIIVLGMLGIGWWVDRQIRSAILKETASTTALYMDSFIFPDLQELKDSTTLTPEHTKELGNLLKTDLGQRIVAFKIWGNDNLVIYSTTPSQIGRRFSGEDGLETAWQGKVVATMEKLDADENTDEETKYTQLLQTFSPIRVTGTKQVIAVAEFYQTVESLNNEIAAAQRWSWLVVTGVMLLIYLALVGFIRQASNTILRQELELTNQVNRLTDLVKRNNELNEHVRNAAANTTAHNEHFLRRISAELHDGPAQELGLALLRLDLVICHHEFSQTGTDSEDATQLTAIQTLLQNAMKEVRTIASGLGMPQLDELSLTEIITRAVRSHERRTGTEVPLIFENPLPGQATLAVKITVFRVIQEALNNAYRHAGGINQTVIVNMAANQICIKVSDGGPGFDVDQQIDWEAHLGLAGMRERVESLGGLFQIESGNNKGTKVMAALAVQPEEEEIHG
jgi:signal transduction histidine kinase